MQSLSRPTYLQIVARGSKFGIKITALGLLTFVCALAKSQTIDIGGRVYVVELLLPAVAIVVLLAGRTGELWRLRAFWTLLLAMLGMLAGYVLSDLVAGTPTDQYLKGWGRTLFVITDFVSLAIVVAADRRNLWWFVLGIGLGEILNAKLIQHLPVGDFSAWKFSYGLNVIMTFSALGYFLPSRIAAICFAMVGFWSMTHDARSWSALAIGTAALLWTRAPDRRRVRRGFSQYARLGAALAIAGLVVLALLRSTETEWTEARRSGSNVPRLLYQMAAIRLIAASPIVGYGSWGRTEEIATAAREAFAGNRATGWSDANSAVSIHSQILQSWVEAGIGAGLFFMIYAWFLIKALRYVTFDRVWDGLAAPLVVVMAIGLWDLFLSPYVATQRLSITMACAAIVVTEIERKMQRRAARAERMQAGAVVANAVQQKKLG
jgi:hypothetical protein